MGKERPEVLIHDTPKERLLRHFKTAVIMFDESFPKDRTCSPAEVIFKEKKKSISSIRRTELTDQEFVEEWLGTSKIPPYNAYQIGLALGEMIASEKNASDTSTSK